VLRRGATLEGYQLLQADSGQHYFRLVAENGTVIARGETYASKGNATRGILTVTAIVRALRGGLYPETESVTAAYDESVEFDYDLSQLGRADLPGAAGEAFDRWSQIENESVAYQLPIEGISDLAVYFLVENYSGPGVRVGIFRPDGSCVVTGSGNDNPFIAWPPKPPPEPLSKRVRRSPG
jgi:uncharacterized protein YegP (UPF0339 family)